MNSAKSDPIGHSHVFLGTGHEGNERRTWTVIWLCMAMMILEIGGGLMFGSVALVADGLHMSTHAAALLIAAAAYTYARRHANDSRFGFGTGKFGDLAGFSSAIILGMVALLIGYEAVERLFSPVGINFNEALPIAVLGLAVNIISAWMLSGGDHGHGHGHSHGHSHGHGHDHGPAAPADPHAPARLDTGHGVLNLEVFEKNCPPRFRLYFEGARRWTLAETPRLEIERADGSHQLFTLANRGDYLESVEEVPEPHEFTVRLRLPHEEHVHDHMVVFSDHASHTHETHDHGAHDHGAHDHGSHGHGAHDHGGHGHDHDHHHGHDHDHHAEKAADSQISEKMRRDNNMRAAFVHVLADAAVSVLVILGLCAGKFLGWTFMDPVMGLVGAAVIANWSYTLIRDTGGILLDMTPDAGLVGQLRAAVEKEGDHLADLHLWRLGPGHLGAIVSIVSDRPQAAEFYRCRLGGFPMLSHLTIEVRAR